MKVHLFGSAVSLLVVAISLADILLAPKGVQVLADDNDKQDLSNIEWWKKTNFYHIYLRSFKDTNGDGNGDLRGVIEKLDYLKELGVETLLMAPFYSSPMKDCGYDIDNYYNINPMFGTMEDFDNLIRELKARNMRIVVDFVPNHTSNEHPWFQCSERAFIEPERCGKYKDYYVWTDSRQFEGRLPSNWVSVFGGGPAWTWSELRKQFYLHQFLPQQPDLNFTNPDVRQDFKFIARFWFIKGVDGLRVDSVNFIIENTNNFPNEPLNPNWKQGDDPADRLLHVHTRGIHEGVEIVRDWREVAEEAQFKGRKVIITEAYDVVPKLVEYYGNSSTNRYADLPFNFVLFKLNEENFSDAPNLERVVTSWLRPTRALQWPNERGAMSPWIIWVTGNHDNKRLVNRLGRENVATFKWLTYLMPGVPVNYYGDEMPLHNANFTDIPKRTIDEGEPTRLPFRAPIAWTNEKPSGGFSSSYDIWMPINGDFERQNVQRLLSAESEPNNELKLFVALQQLRKQKLELFTFGDLLFFINNVCEGTRQVLALARTHAKFGNLLLLANLNKKQSLVVHLKPSDRKTEVFGEQAPEPPKSGKILMVNYENVKLAPSVVQGATVELVNLILAPSQTIIVEY